MRREWSLLALALAGCIPIPVGLPPAKAALGMGAAFGNPIPSPVDGTPLTEAEPVLVGRVGLTPQTLWPTQHRRPIEIAAGYAFHVFTNELRQNRNRHGVFLGLEVLGGDFWLGDNWRARIVVRGSTEYFALQDHPGDGGGGSWSLGFEVAQYVRHESSSSGPGLLGYAAGELSLGAEVFGSMHSVGGADYGTVGLAMTLRWPGALGVVLIPLTGSF